jgi:hypothetical protein
VKVTIEHKNRTLTWNVHPAIGLAIVAWLGLCVFLTTWLLHPSPYNSDAGSRAYMVVLIYFGLVIAKHGALLVLTHIEKRQARRHP